jgi:hypothetical protein
MRQVIFKLDEYPEIQFKGGSADGENLKGCYIEIKGCLESKMEDHNKNIFRFKKKLNHTIEKFLSDSILSKKFIRTDKISDSFTYTGYSFSTFEYTFFPKTTINKELLIDELNKLIKQIYSNNIENNTDITFHKNLYKGKRGEK